MPCEPGDCPLARADALALAGWRPKDVSSPIDPVSAPATTATATKAAAAAPVTAMRGFRGLLAAGRRCRAGWCRRSAGGRTRVWEVTAAGSAPAAHGTGAVLGGAGANARNAALATASSESSRRVAGARSAASVLSTGRRAAGVLPVSPDSKASRSRSSYAGPQSGGTWLSGMSSSGTPFPSKALHPCP